MRLRYRAWRSAARLAILALIVSTAILAFDRTVPTAHAGCEELDPAEALAQADAVVEGTVVAVQKPRLLVSSSDRVVYTIEVARVYESSSRAVQERIEATAPYGYGLGDEGTSWLLFLRGENPRFETDACSAAELPIQTPRIADEVAGWTATAPEPGGVELPSAGAPWPAIGTGALVLAMVVLLVRDARRRKRHA